MPINQHGQHSPFKAGAPKTPPHYLNQNSGWTGQMKVKREGKPSKSDERRSKCLILAGAGERPLPNFRWRSQRTRAGK